MLISILNIAFLYQLIFSAETVKIGFAVLMIFMLSLLQSNSVHTFHELGQMKKYMRKMLKRKHKQHQNMITVTFLCIPLKYHQLRTTHPCIPVLIYFHMPITPLTFNDNNAL